MDNTQLENLILDHFRGKNKEARRFLSALASKLVDKHVQVCQLCGKEFEAKIGSRYCSNACRCKAYRDRKNN